ncbi:hypothetical protein [Streptomyces sp. YIM S03343]
MPADEVTHGTDVDESRGRTGPRHAAPKKPLFTRFHMPAGKAIAMAAMPTAVLVGMGFTSTLALAAGNGSTPTTSNSQSAEDYKNCVAALNGASASPSASASASDSATPSPSASDSGSSPSSDSKSSDSGSGSGSGTSSSSDSGSGDKATPTPSATSGSGTSTATASPSASASSGSLLDTIGDTITGILTGGGGGSGSDSGSSSSASPTPSATPSASASSTGTGSSGSGSSGSSSTVKDTAKKVTDTASETADTATAATESATPSATASPSPSASSSTDTSDCVAATDAVSGVDNKVPVADDPWYLNASSLLLKGADYKGVVEVKSANGTVKKVLKFVISGGTDIGDLHQTVNDKQSGKTYHVQAESGSTSTIRDGDTVMYTESISGNLFGLVPVTFSPASPPPLNIPLIYFTNVKVTQAAQFGGSLHIPGMHVYTSD